MTFKGRISRTMVAFYSKMAEAGCFVEFIVISELLRYVQNNFSKATANGLLTAISGFYTVDEIVLAKSKLFEVAKEFITAVGGRCTDDLPR